MKNPIKTLGRIKGANLHALKEWCAAQAVRPSTSTYVVGDRAEAWYRYECKLSREVRILTCPTEGDRVYQLGQRLLPDNHCCLFLRYAPGAFIRPHRDHKSTEAKVVQVNVGCEVDLTVGGERYRVGDGEVVEFDSKQLHSVSAAPAERFVISWRRIKSEYLNPQLSLALA